MNRHQVDATSLISGLVFAGVALVYLIAENSALEVDVRWALPLALIGLGIGGVVGAVTSATSAQRTSEGGEELTPQSE